MKILIQGAMTLEIEHYLSVLKHKKEEIVKSYRFWTGELAGHDIIISRTKMGTLNSSIATMLGIMTWSPELVLNQGTSGSHLEEIHTGDIVVGSRSEYLNYLVMPVKGEGEGSDALQWKFNDQLKSREATKEWVDFFERQPYEKGNKFVGVIGSGDIYSREVDRIHWIQRQKKNLCEDMESASVYEVCHKMDVPKVSVRIISNNELTGEPFQKETARTLQEFIIKSLESISKKA